MRCICPAGARGGLGGLPDSAVSFSCSALIAISHYLVRPNGCHSFSRRDCSACYPPCTSPKLKSRNRFVRARVYCNIIYYVIAARVRVPTYMRVSIRRGGRDTKTAKRGEKKKRKTLGRRRRVTAAVELAPPPTLGGWRRA